MRLFVYSAQGIPPADPADLPRLLAADDSVVWVDFTGPTDADVQVMAEVFHFHPLAIEDTRNYEQRPKVEEYAGYLFMILNPVTLNGSPAPAFHELDIFVGRNYVVTAHRDGSTIVDEARRRLERSGPALPPSPGSLLYVLMDTVVDGYFPVLDLIEEQIETLGDTVLVNPNQNLLNDLFDLKNLLLQLWRVVWPQRDILNNLAHYRLPFVADDALHHYFRDISDHLMWTADMVNTFRDTLTGIMDLYMSAVSNRLNRVVNRLTVFTVVIGLLTVIGGFYGMNFEHTWPPFDGSFGVPFVIGLMLATTAGLLALFRRLGWY